MQIDGTLYNASLMEILVELQNQLHINNISLIKDIKDSGNNIQITCPYHKNGEERKPSFGIHKETGIGHCFTCGETHTLSEIISHCFGHKDFGLFGRQWLLKNFASISVEDRKDIKLDFSRNNRSITNDSSTKQKKYVSEEELDSYRYYHPYWGKRGITNENIIELFDLGFDISTQAITFPIKDINGNCLFVARRSVNTKWFNYPENAEKSLYGMWELNQLLEYPKEIIVCESMLDALKCWEFGKYAVAMNGLGTSLIYKQLSELPCRKLILATDMDDAGLKARNKLKKAIKGKIITEYLWDVHEAKDINDMSFEYFSNLKEVM